MSIVCASLVDLSLEMPTLFEFESFSEMPHHRNARWKKAWSYAPAIWTKVMQTESKQKTLSHSAWLESLYLGQRKPFPVSKNYFRRETNISGLTKAANAAVWTRKSTIRKPLDGRKVLPVTCDVEYSLPVEHRK